MINNLPREMADSRSVNHSVMKAKDLLHGSFPFELVAPAVVMVVIWLRISTCTCLDVNGMFLFINLAIALISVTMQESSI